MLELHKVNPLSRLWLSFALIFDLIQNGFNGDFWQVFEKKFAKFAQGKKVLDLACGTGVLRDYIKPKEYLGIDLNDSYLNYAQKRFKDHKTSFINDDITQNIPSNFDVAFLISAAHHLSDSDLFLLSKRIKKTKIKIFIVIDGYPKGFLSVILSWLDSSLAGGKYFRNQISLASTLSQNLKVKKIGRFKAQGSFYQYPYVILAAS